MKKSSYLSVMLIAAVMLLAIVGYRLIYLIQRQEVIAPSNVQQARMTEEEPVNMPARTATQGEPSELKDIYGRYPKSDTGDNMTEAWSRVKPEDKAKFTEELDKRISTSKERLKENPNDDEAKHMLFITESLKKMAADGFNYKLQEPVSEKKEDVSQVKK